MSHTMPFTPPVRIFLLNVHRTRMPPISPWYSIVPLHSSRRAARAEAASVRCKSLRAHERPCASSARVWYEYALNALLHVRQDAARVSTRLNG
jgi:hypothetical protein